ncbi:MAG TPA: histidine ammonia-lyase [Fimbriimonadales bacterium]|nr:histidine ammonia-lyase [Fimbriimonadales bacterium]
MERVILEEPSLRIEDIVAVANGATVEISQKAIERAIKSRAILENLEKSETLIYGVNTGFGALKSEIIEPKERIHLQENLIRSHAVGVGEPLGTKEVRASMLLMAASLLRGHSGVGPEAAQLICEFLNRSIHPNVPRQGSLGASGDLAPLAHIALALMGEGTCRSDDGSLLSSHLLMAEHGLAPLALTSKLGLSLINGTHVHTAIAALLTASAKTLAKAADIACAMNIEATLCSAQPFRDEVHVLRPHPHQMRSAKNIKRLIENSELVASHAHCGEVQDAYSIRCAPQVHGAARNSITHLREVVEIEISSVTDNPLVIGDEVVSAGHFHGEPVGLALDYFKIGISELASISERRTERSLNKDYNRGLPPFLIEHAGLRSGLMMCQYTSAALVSENKVLSHPSCVDTINTGANQEDHVSMAMNAALHAQKVFENTYKVIAIELIVGAQALDCRAKIQKDKPGLGVQAAWRAVREMVEKVEEDRSLSDEIQRFELERVVEAVEKEIGDLD